MDVGNLQELASGMSSIGSVDQLLRAKAEDDNQEAFKTDHLLTNLKGAV
jgi:hypothetical protein